MDLKRTLFTGLAAAGLMASVATPMAMAQPVTGSGETTAIVTITDGGDFDAYFCVSEVLSEQASLTEDVAPTASTPGKASGILVICYDDTRSNRPAFNTRIQAGTFVDPLATVQTPIGASNFVVTKTTNVRQTQWTTQGGHPIAVGDIGFFGPNMGIVAQGTGAFADWNANNSLDSGRVVQYGYNGKGTIGADGDIFVELTIPVGTSAGVYESDVTLTIDPGTRIRP